MAEFLFAIDFVFSGVLKARGKQERTLNSKAKQERALNLNFNWKRSDVKDCFQAQAAFTRTEGRSKEGLETHGSGGSKILMLHNRFFFQ